MTTSTARAIQRDAALGATDGDEHEVMPPGPVAGIVLVAHA